MPLSQSPSTPYYRLLYSEDALRPDLRVNLNTDDLVGLLVGAIQGLLDDLEDAGEAQSEEGREQGIWYSSVAYAYAARDRALPEPHDPPLVKVRVEVSRVVPNDEGYLAGAEHEIWEEVFDMPEELIGKIEHRPAWGCTAADIDTPLVESANWFKED